MHFIYGDYWNYMVKIRPSLLLIKARLLNILIHVFELTCSRTGLLHLVSM